MYHAVNRSEIGSAGKSLLLLFSIAAVLLINSNADGQRRVFGNVLSQLNQDSVVIYDIGNFKGSYKTLGVGEYNLADVLGANSTGGTIVFDEAVSSIKVPVGLVVLAYENAADKGSGIWVDLLEDHYELSSLNLDNKISYLRIFRSPDSRGYIWARNSIINGQFVAGHWERKRANGNNPVNPTAVVAPSLAPRDSTEPTAIAVNGAQSTITTLGVQNSGDAALWNTAETVSMGVIGSDYRGIEEIGSAAFERASHNTLIPDNLNFWYPQKQPRDHRSIVYFKRTLIGKIAGTVENDDEKDDRGNPVTESEEPHIANVVGTFEDHDVNLDVEPASNYMYLITDAHKPEVSTIQSLQLRGEHIGLHNPGGGYKDPCTLPFKVLEAEIDMHPNAKNELIEMAKQRIGQPIGIYGTWIYDKGHCHQPEIHPAEQIWWSKNIGANRVYNLNVFCDASARFWWRSQMDDGTKLKPWGAPPIKGTFALAFEVEIKPGKYFGKKFELQEIDSYNVVTPRDHRIYNLVYQDNSLISFDPKGGAVKVSFEKVGLKQGTTNIVRGFLVLETTVGSVTQIATRVGSVNIPQGTDPNDAAKVPEDVEKKAFKKEEGQYMFTIYQTAMR